jgi:hypothetical protein
MFETRLHVVQPNDALSKRKLWEGWLQWANRLSGIGSDAVARGQFARNKFTIDTFLELFHDGQDVSGDNGSVANEAGTLVAASKKIVSLDISGNYWVNWSLGLTTATGECRFVGGVPFVGNTFIGSAQDFKAELGWYNNSDVTECVSRGKEWMGGPFSDRAPTEVLQDNYDSYGKYGTLRKTKTGSPPDEDKDIITPQAGTISGEPVQQSVNVHLSGSGSAVLGRSTGNVGILLFCQPGSAFNIVSSRLTLHRRNR